MNERLEKHIPLWLKIGIRELDFHEKYKMSYEQLRNYYIERIVSSNRIIPFIELLNQDGKWYGRRDLNNSGFDGFDLSYFMTSYLISQNIDIETLLEDETKLNQIESNLVQNTINYYNEMFKVKEIKDNFDDVNTPKELMDFMNKNINYGYVDNEGKKHLDTLRGIRENYKIKSEQVILFSKVGNCIDQAKIQKSFFDKKGIENKLYCIQYKEKYNPDKTKVHPITIYKDGNGWNHFEHAFYNYRGIHEFDDIENLLETFKTECFSSVESIDVKEIDNIPDNLSMDEFIEYIQDFEKKAKKTI